MSKRCEGALLRMKDGRYEQCDAPAEAGSIERALTGATNTCERK